MAIEKMNKKKNVRKIFGVGPLHRSWKDSRNTQYKAAPSARVWWRIRAGG